MMEHLLTITLFSTLCFTGTRVHGQRVVVPQGIAAVNGSSTDMGCSGVEQSGSHTICNCSYLNDGVSPDIDTSSSDWASQLVTVRRDPGNPIIDYPHVLLTFAFDTPVSPTGIEIDLFNCPDWKIGATDVTAYFNPQYEPSLNFSRVSSFASANPLPQPSCDSLSTVTLSVQEGNYRTIYILVDLQSSPIEWVHVGEVRFTGINIPNCPQPTTSIPSTTPQTSASSSSSSQSGNMSASTTPLSSNTKTSISSLTVTRTTTHSMLVTPSFNPTTLTSVVPLSTPSKLSSTSSKPFIVSESTNSSSFTRSTSQPEENPSKSTTESANQTPTSQPSGGENTLVIALVGIIVGLVVLAFIFAGLIVFFLTKRHSHCNKRRYMVKTASYELEKRYSPHGNISDGLEATNPLHMSNSRYVCPTASMGTNGSDDHYDLIKQENILPVNDAYYDIVALDEPLPSAETSTSRDEPHPPPEPSTSHSEPLPPQRPPTSDIVFDEEEELGEGMYEIIRTETRPSVPVRSLSQSNAPREDQPGVAEASSGAKPGLKDTRVYSIIKRERAPEVPEKNLDLKDYLRVRIPFNENIYSESIDRSDFISKQPEPEYDTLSDAIIYPPIYPSFTVLPESFELPAEVNDGNIKAKSIVRIGHYGDVVLADTMGLSLKDMHLSKTENNKDVSITVAAKRLKTNATPSQRRAFETEAKFLSRLRHPNVVRLLGASYEDPAFIMMEYLKEGDLSQFLHNYTEVVSEASPSSTTQITPSTLVFMASQIASGMKRLAELDFIHRDLATRNCLIGKKFSVKVASLGVDKNLYQSHYFTVQGNTLLPIRWMASECFDGKFSEKSDVWAFGVTLWEMFTLAKQLPYRHLTNEEVIHNALKRDYRQIPSQSPSCSQSVCEIMERCWIMDMKERTTFDELHTLLQTAI